MLAWMRERESLWERLQKTEKPLVLYGMGDGAVKVKAVLDQLGIPVAAVFASDEFVRGNSFLGYKLLRLDQVEAMFSDFLILLCFAVRDQPTIDRIFQLAQRFELAVPDVPVAGESLFSAEFLSAHEAEFDQVYQLLADDQSKKVYANILDFKLSGRPEYLKNCTSSPAEAYENILKLGPNEVYVDLGAYRGETVEEFLHYTSGAYERIIALEPDEKNYKKLCDTLARNQLSRTECYQIAAYSHPATLWLDSCAGRQSALVSADTASLPLEKAPGHRKEVEANSLDELLKGKRVSFLNMDIEGGEQQALQGSRQILQTQKPKLLVAAYHRSEDLFALPLQIAAIRADYQFYFRHNRYLPAWDTNLYCV